MIDVTRLIAVGMKSPAGRERYGLPRVMVSRFWMTLGRMAPPVHHLRRGHNVFLWGVLLTLGLWMTGCAGPGGHAPSAPSASAPPSDRAEQFLVVDCLLPPRVKKLGSQLTFLEPRRPIKTSAQECEIRGGEYVSYDRSDLRTSLHVWLDKAKTGDAQAQTYVGEIFEKGLGVPPDYEAAAQWYQKAAEQGYERAQINLGHLYETGLGVEKNPALALQWYRKAAGLTAAVSLDASTYKWNTLEVQAATVSLREEVEHWKQEAAQLRQQYEHAQQEMEQARGALAQHQHDLEVAQHQAETVRQELEVQRQAAAGGAARDTSEIQRLEQQLQQRESELERQRNATAQLHQEIARLESDVATQRGQLTQMEQQRQQVAIAGPSIQIVDPPLNSSLTRGIAIAFISPKMMGQQRLVIGKVVAPAGLLSLTVNDQQRQVDSNGMFRVPISLESALVPVKAVAVDKQGEHTEVEFQLTSRNGAEPAAPPRESIARSEFGSYHALVIGNQTYSAWPALGTPESDAREVASILKQKYGFKTAVLLNATRYDILQALNNLRKELTDDSNLLIYYAGHGHWDEKILRGYWVPVDGDVDSNVNWISTVAVTDMLSAIPARHVLVVADSCYSGALTRSSIAHLDAEGSDKARTHWLRLMSQKRSRTVLTAGGLQPVLDSGGGRHSVFAKAFIDALNSNAAIIEGQRLHKEVDARVAYAAASQMAEQVPEYAPIQHAGHEAGDFIFVPSSVLQ